jgi:hypothetical protein
LFYLGLLVRFPIVFPIATFIAFHFCKGITMTLTRQTAYAAGQSLSQVDRGALRAITASAFETALRNGHATHESFQGFEIDVWRLDATPSDDSQHHVTAGVRCVISRCGTLIEEHDVIVPESMQIRLMNARD